MIPQPLKSNYSWPNAAFKDYMEEVVQAMKDKDYNHLAMLINLETNKHGISVTAKEFK